jgi:CheY-like chemotaxis protein
MRAIDEIKILVIDDNPKILQILTNLLKSFGLQKISQFWDPLEALEQIEKLRPDLILCDIMMAPMNGKIVLKRIRSHPAPSIAKLPVIMITASGHADDVAESQKFGANAYLVKPVSPQMLWSRICSVLGLPKASQNIDPARLQAKAAAEENLAELGRTYHLTLQKEATNLRIAYVKAQALNFRKTDLALITAPAHDIKGQASSFGFDLAGAIAESLCAFIRSHDDAPDVPDQIKTKLATVLDMHIDAIETCAKDIIAGPIDENGRDLLAVLQKSADKISQDWTQLTGTQNSA